LTFFASRNALPAEFSRIIRLIEDGRIDTRPWITHQASFEGMIGEFPRWLKPETGVIKAMVQVDGRFGYLPEAMINKKMIKAQML
jgi:threonine dehydrogenase-like Zn-dependent dehydrogenase